MDIPQVAPVNSGYNCPTQCLVVDKRDIPYQSLMKMFLAERIEHELNRKSER
jgi:hypothetical protein